MKKMAILIVSLIFICLLYDILLYVVPFLFFLENSYKLFLFGFLILILFFNVLDVILFKENRQQKYKIIYLAYIILVFMILFLREDKMGDKNDDIFRIDYLYKWYPLIFTNKTVFLNVFGNIFLFIPITLYISYKDGVLFTFINLISIILLVEIIQSITNYGIFDVVDIILNIFGIIIGIFLFLTIKGLIIWMETIKRSKQKKRILKN